MKMQGKIHSGFYTIFRHYDVMYISAQFDSEASSISQKITFYCGHFELHRNHITLLKEQKLIKFVEEALLPELITCQILIYCENYKTAKVIVFNSTFAVDSSIYDEPILNKDFINRSHINGGFRIEFEIPLSHPSIKLDLTIEF